MQYTVTHKSISTIDADWNKADWQDVSPLRIESYMGDKPDHFPRVQARLAYDDQYIYVIFRVDDQYVRSIRTELHSEVCRDSCVEFFFAPGPDISVGYFNVETNCGGTMLLYHQQDRDDPNRVEVSPEDCGRIELAHSMPKVVEPEITEPTTWTLEYRIPFDMLTGYTSVTRPVAGATWKANLYKCADQTSHPHWLTWAPVDLPRPDFHQPTFFGDLVFA